MNSNIDSSSFGERITPFSLNSAAKIEYSILSQGHWYDALRMAENIIQEKQDAIAYAEIQKQEQEEKIAYQKKHLQYQPPLERITIYANIARWTVDCQKQERLLEDAHFEMQVALRLKQQILEQNPEIATMDYQQIQEKGSYQAYLHTKAEQLACTAVSLERNLPAELVKFLLSDQDVLTQIEPMITQNLRIIEGKLDQLEAACDQEPNPHRYNPHFAKLQSMLNDR